MIHLAWRQTAVVAARRDLEARKKGGLREVNEDLVLVQCFMRMWSVHCWSGAEWGHSESPPLPHHSHADAHPHMCVTHTHARPLCVVPPFTPPAAMEGIERPWKASERQWNQGRSPG